MTWPRVFALLLVTLVACSQPRGEELPEGSVAVVPAVRAAELDVATGTVFVQATPRTPVGSIVDDAIRGLRAAEIVAAIGQEAPAAYLPACTGAGDVIVAVPQSIDQQEVRQVLFDIVRGLDFVDISEPKVVDVSAVADLTCAAAGRPLP